MYLCQLCGTVVPKGISRQVIVHKRPYQHPYRRAVNRKVVFERGKKQQKWVDDPGGSGMQVTTEIPVCPRCLTEHNDKQQ